MKVVRASESQSRKRALDILGLAYEIHPSAIDEKSVRDSDPAALTKKLAEAKARKVASAFDDAVVVSGDAVVAKHSKIFEEPRSNRKRLNSYASFPAAPSCWWPRSRAWFGYRQNALRCRNFQDQISSPGRP